MALNQNVNVWIVVTDNVWKTIKERINDDDYDGELVNAVRAIRMQADPIGSSRSFRKPTLANKKRKLISINFPKGSRSTIIKEALALLDTELGNKFQVAGAWWWDGRQVGTKWVNDEDHSEGVKGSPLYPTNPTQLVKFMPDVVVDNSDPENPVYGPATELTDVNLTQGQAKRQF